jgi:hypothetical protein
MRPNNAPRERRKTRTKHHPPPTLPLHRRQAQLREQKRRPAVCSPCRLERFHADVLDRLGARIAPVRARIVEQYRGRAETLGDFFVEPTGLEMERSHQFPSVQSTL